jgi:purine-nucleoside phosphorylase
MVNLDTIYPDLFNKLKSIFTEKIDIAIILGSGLGEFANQLELIKSIPTSELPNYPPSTVQGHQGKIHFAKLNEKNIVLFQGRIHFYEGYPFKQLLLPVHISYKLGCKKIILTNAAGGINVSFLPGDLMLVTSVNSFGIKKELTEFLGLASSTMKLNFYDFPSDEIKNKIIQAAELENIVIQQGTYWFSLGPSYETPAEIRMMTKFGGDAVGMSTVHEAIYASTLGIKVGMISCITNFAAGISKGKLSHFEVTETANRVKDKFERLLKRTISLL